MKRIIFRLTAVFFCFSVLLFCFCGCDNTVFANENQTIGIFDKNDDCLILENNSYNNEDENNCEKELFTASWLSYFELASYGKTDKEQYKEHIEKIMKNLEKAGIGNIFVQVRPFADSIYPSKIFPCSVYISGKRGDESAFDAFSVIIDCARESGIKVHAWINPYRIQRELDTDKLCEKETALLWLEEKSGKVIETAGGLYFNPASVEAQQLIISGVREILEGYAVDGIHIDDYFYPSADESIDKKQFDQYVKNGGTLELSAWRRENVSALVSGLYETVKLFGKEKIFSISPCGDIDKNEDIYYADVKRWCSCSGYCDMIIPQVYYGFENESKPFEKCVLEWKSLMCDEVRLCVGLALYKCGKTDTYAGEKGKDEWLENDDIMKRQTQFLLKNGIDAVSIYSAGCISFGDDVPARETKNLCDVLN